MNMRQKRRKRLAKEWSDFQQRFELSDGDLKLARSTGYPPSRVEAMLEEEEYTEFTCPSGKIRAIHRLWMEKMEKRKAAVEAGLIEPKDKKAKTKKSRVQHSPQWAKAKRVCRLNMEDIRKAKELGLSPRKLMKNVPSPTQQWKLPVKLWIQELYEKRERRKSNREEGNT